MKPTNPSGTRDFLPDEMLRRDLIFNNCRQVFRKYGYLPIETPAMENLETLTGKYGDEGDRLIFKILPRGETLKKALTNILGLIQIPSMGINLPPVSIENVNPTVLNQLAQEALRYDLTVPFARYVVQHQNEITFPFKRFQIQPVWRAEKPQKGRYREFYQCDVDVIGSDSLLNEVELIQMIDEVFGLLKLNDFTICLNHRKILEGLAETLKVQDKFNSMITALDKWAKTGKQGVENELKTAGFDPKVISKIITFAQSADLNDVEKIPCGAIGRKGLDEISEVFHHIDSLKIANVRYEPSLARGLDYYTGVIIEVKVKDFPGSICGGGRYDDLTGVFGLKGVSGVGVSFGADRIYDVMDIQNLFTEHRFAATKIMFVNFGREEEVL